MTLPIVQFKSAAGKRHSVCSTEVQRGKSITQDKLNQKYHVSTHWICLVDMFCLVDLESRAQLFKANDVVS